jgi:hypothetical protein
LVQVTPGPPPPHWSAVVHSTQYPPGPQTGCSTLALHDVVVHVAVHSFVCRLHVGRAPLGQFALLVHATHVFVVVLQAGVVPVHRVASLAVHATHVFVVVSHTGRAALPLQFVFERHSTQVLVAVSQTSPSLVQLAVLPVVHWTQVKVVVSQTVRWPPCAAHSPLLMHWTQVPALQ